MDRTPKAKKKSHPAKGNPEPRSSSKDTFTADMHIIVTRSKEKIREDDMFEPTLPKPNMSVYH